MIWGNPAGAWALLGVPALLLVHVLQRRRQRVVVHTAFLLAPAANQSVSGRRLDRLRSSVSLWLQIAVVLCVAWLLVEPRLARQDLALKAVFVLDSSASLSAFRDEALLAVERRAAELARLAAHVDYTLLETALDRPALYAGRDLPAFRKALEAWQPCRPGHDVGPALEMGRRIAGGDGALVFVTDQVGEGLVEEERIAVGAPKDNVGFVTGDVSEKAGEGWGWHATIKNYGRSGARRTLGIAVDGRSAGQIPLELPPHSAREVGGALPPRARRAELRLDADALQLDDRMPLVVPQPRALRVSLPAADDETRAIERFLRTVAAVTRVTPGAEADLAVVLTDTAAASPGASVLLLGGRAASAKAATRDDAASAIVSADHPLMRDLTWSSLRLGGPPVPLPAAPAARREILAWAGTRPLIALDERRRLTFAFSLAKSNIERLPAFPLLLHRFSENARQSAPGIERANYETGELLPVLLRLGQAEWLLEREGLRRHADVQGELKAPWQPGYFRLSEGRDARVDGAAHFCDTREADLSGASSGVSGNARARATLVRLTRPDPLAPLALVLGLGLMLADWALGQRGSAGR